MGTQPPGTGPRWGAQWRSPGMAASYDARHAYPPETFDVIAGLRAADSTLPTVEVGAGNGRVTAGLVAAGLVPIDAVEPSPAMVERAPALDGVRWLVTTFEDADLDGPYGLAVAGESIHWTDWTVSFPKLSRLLTDGAVLALVGLLESAPGAGRPGSQSWLPDLQPVITEFATSKEYVPYNLPAELRDRGCWTELGTHRTAWHPRIQTVDDLVRRHHSMNGLSPEALGDDLGAFDDALRRALAAHADADGVLPCEVAGEIRWGRPLGP